jgi:hypothetical protein
MLFRHHHLQSETYLRVEFLPVVLESLQDLIIEEPVQLNFDVIVGL